MSYGANSETHLPNRASPTRRTLRWVFLRGIAVMRRRSLIGEIFVLQLACGVAVTVVALGALWWASNWLMRDNMRAWGEQWLDNLDELGMPLYLSEGNEKFARIDAYVNEFTEILFVRYYSESGTPLFAKLHDGNSVAIPPLDVGTLEEIAFRPAQERRYVLETVFREIPVVQIGKPIWARSFVSDGLLGFDPNSSAVEETLIGYVELGLDFSYYRAYLVRTTLTAVLVGVAIFVLLTVASWRIYKRALMPLAELQAPLKKLARGEIRTSVAVSGHREIARIADALNSTVSALDERDRQLSVLASRDALTGLINRQRFSELLEREMESAAQCGRTSAVLFIDLDHFAHVNDSLGYAGGDQFLTRAAEWLVEKIGPLGIVARSGADEFLVLLEDVTKQQVVDICAELVTAVREQRFTESDHLLNVRCSIGVAMIRGTRVTPATLLSQSDMACRQAKSNGRNQFHIYQGSSKGVAEMAADVAWSQRIRTALAEDDFIFHYQPIVSLRTRETAYYEVLLRMRVANDRLVFPGTFIPAATRFGLMVEIDRWVIRHSLRALAALRAARGDVRFTLNVSGSTFDAPDFFDYLESQLQASGVPLEAIVIEITEQVAIRSLLAAAKRMTELVSRGCRFAIDDFGSGYCSYSYLKELPVAFVKIDGRFIANIAQNTVDQKIVSAIREVAKAAGCETIAEHVKDHETVMVLGELGVDYAQGYYLGKPSASITSAALPVPLAGARRKTAARRAAELH